MTKQSTNNKTQRCLNFKPLNNYKELVEKAGSFKTYKKKEGEKRIQYLDLVCAFDIETSSFLSTNGLKHACMYTWQFGINGNVYVGRTWEEFEECIEYISQIYETNDKRRIIVWVHNLSYEFAWIAYRFNWESVFAREKRNPMKAVTTNGIEFRCSYILSGSGLAHVAENLTTYKVSKMVGDLDYTKVRGPETPLTQEELQYCINDILVVTAYIWEQIDIYKKITSIPLTNTGRVRNLFRNNCLGKENYHKYTRIMSNLIINNQEEYEALKRAFCGGFTHANYRHAGDVCENVQSYDFTSSYPTVMIADKFPMGPATMFNKSTVEYITENTNKYCFVFNIRFTKIRPKLWQDNPISISKCYKSIGIKQNNGRLISADEITMTITDVDFTVIKDFYEWDSVEVGKTWRYPKAYLPKPFVETIVSLYEDKTTLKDVTGKEVDYLLKKGMLNSSFGMTVMDVLQEEIWFDYSGWHSNEGDVSEILAEYNSDERRFLFYPWGVFVTAYARRNLFYAIKECGDDYIYADTDSVKIMNYEKHKNFFDRYNNWITARLVTAAKFHGIDPSRLKPKTIQGIEKPLGVFDDDGFYTKFKTLGAKRYLVETKEGKLKATVAGVNKKGIAKYLSEQKDPFTFFDDKMTVPAEYSGKTQCAYFDEPIEGITTDYLGNSFEYHELSGVHLGTSDYNLTISSLYATLLNSKTEVLV